MGIVLAPAFNPATRSRNSVNERYFVVLSLGERIPGLHRFFANRLRRSRTRSSLR